MKIRELSAEIGLAIKGLDHHIRSLSIGPGPQDHASLHFLAALRGERAALENVRQSIRTDSLALLKAYRREGIP